MSSEHRAIWWFAALCGLQLCVVSGLVAAGEPARKELWWSLRPLERTSVPVVADPPFPIRNPIDAFILARLRAKGLAPNPQADRRTLIRRMTFDLVGLPPAPEEVESFVRDTAPFAYERLVERLLASPHYGERWARHWLDVVHYGETHGYDKDKPRPNAWPYRDYVIRAFNEDRPYWRFVQEQIAGDVLFPGTVEGIDALGFLSAGPWDLIGHTEVPEDRIDGKISRHLDRDDMVATTIGTFNSMTVHCAQCHHHKFDPIRQEDYYRLQAVFAALDRADSTYDTDPAVAARRRLLEERLQTAEGRVNGLKARVAQLTGAKRAIPPELQKETEQARVEMTEVQQALTRLPPPRVVYAGTVYRGTGAFRGTGASGGQPRPIFVLARGDVRRPGKEVGPGALSLLPGLPAAFELPVGHPEGQRRAALARWLTDPKNSLTWRSLVNRVWLYHMGRGIVDSPNDFGKMGQAPTHPELLDWLAVEFRDGGQSLKRLQRLIVTSSTYRQSSADNPAQARVDTGSQYYWRMQRRKLEAEAVRDSILQVSGKLDLRMGGPSFQDFVIERPEHSPHYHYHLHDPEDRRAQRRSVYRFIVRSQQQPFLATLDCADPSLAVEKRNQTITPQQALALLNNQLILVMARHFASRVTHLESDPTAQIGTAFRLALGRPPTPPEQQLLAEYTRQHGLPAACRVLFNLNEFVFVD